MPYLEKVESIFYLSFKSLLNRRIIIFSFYSELDTINDAKNSPGHLLSVSEYGQPMSIKNVDVTHDPPQKHDLDKLCHSSHFNLSFDIPLDHLFSL